MKKYKWKEVVEFLEENENRELYYGNPRLNDKCGCLMSEFFKSKGFVKDDSLSVNHRGTQLVEFVENEDKIIAEIEDFPLGYIGEIHCEANTSREILKYLKKDLTG